MGVNAIVSSSLTPHASFLLTPLIKTLPQVPTQIFITDELPKTATGKIQRRFMVDAFITKKTGA